MKGISEKTLIKIKDLKASVKLNNGDMLTTVTNANMELQRGRSYAIVGKSGSGKTSLISIIGLLIGNMRASTFMMVYLFLL